MWNRVGVTPGTADARSSDVLAHCEAVDLRWGGSSNWTTLKPSTEKEGAEPPRVRVFVCQHCAETLVRYQRLPHNVLIASPDVASRLELKE